MSTPIGQTLFFSVNHIIKPYSTKLIYGIKYKELEYFLFKTVGINDCEQLDTNLPLSRKTFERICDVITEIEKEYNKTPPLENINIDVFNAIVRSKNPRYDEYLKNKGNED